MGALVIVGKFLLKHLDKIIIALLVIAVVMFIYVRGRSDERAKLQPKIDSLTTELTQLKKDYKDASDRYLAEIKTIKEENKANVEKIVAHMQERIHENNTVADNLRGELRRARANSGRPLAPIGTAPATCGDYEADRTKLPARDQDILVGVAERANECAITLKGCQAYAVETYEKCTRNR
jgi:hypothetical protein